MSATALADPEKLSAERLAILEKTGCSDVQDLVRVVRSQAAEIAELKMDVDSLRTAMCDINDGCVRYEKRDRVAEVPARRRRS